MAHFHLEIRDHARHGPGTASFPPYTATYRYPPLHILHGRSATHRCIHLYLHTAPLHILHPVTYPPRSLPIAPHLEILERVRHSLGTARCRRSTALGLVELLAHHLCGYMLFIGIVCGYHLLLITCHISLITYYVSLTTYYLSRITYRVSLVAYYVSQITFHLSPPTPSAAPRAPPF